MQISTYLVFAYQTAIVLHFPSSVHAFGVFSGSGSAATGAHLLAPIHFTVTGAVSGIQRGSSLKSTIEDDDESYNDDDAFDVEAARKRLEALVGSSNGERQLQSRREGRPHRRNSDPANRRLTVSYTITNLFPGIDVDQLNESGIPNSPPLTTIQLVRREAEIKLLRELADGDGSLSDMWDLWFNERGSQVASLLHKVDELTEEGQDGLERAERMLIELISEHGPHFAEPLNRLATLYYTHNLLPEAKYLWLIVVAVKPWHFGALSGLVKVHADLNDSENALRWAKERLPALFHFGRNKRRSLWVKKSIDQASQKLTEAEQVSNRLFFDLEDEHARDATRRIQALESDVDFGQWQ